MRDRRRSALVLAGLFGTAAGHALLTWPPRKTVGLFLGGMVIATVLELVAVRLGVLRHHLPWRVGGVPVSIVLGWPAIIYGWYRLVTTVIAPGIPAAGLTALLASVADVLLEPMAVRHGFWSYPPHALSRPRVRGIPWWNVAAWPGVVFTTAMVPTLVA